MYHKINDIIELGQHHYRVVKSKKCIYCAFHDTDCFSLIEHIGSCDATERLDKTDVIFRKVNITKLKVKSGLKSDLNRV